MRLQQVRVGAFGPLPSGTLLDLAPGLTVVWGPNEAGKSSWHAALFAGLCGIRRAQGKTADQRELEEAHRPWGGSAWQVAATVALADGRVLDFRHDLDAPEHSRVTDRDTGADLTGELISDGSPDGAQLLGLNRRTLPHTVMVRQAQMLACTERADELAHILQRAAATAGDAATAEEAIALIERAHAESVGSEQARTRPLARTQAALAEAERRLAAARADHAEYLRLCAEHDAAAAEAGDHALRLARLDAELVRREAVALTARADEAERIAGRLPASLVDEVEAGGSALRDVDDAHHAHRRGGDTDRGPALEGGDGADGGGDGRGGESAAPTGSDDSDDDPDAAIAEEVARARAGWELRPADPGETGDPAEAGESADALRAALARLPGQPEGDTEVAAEVEAAAGQWRDARTARDWHDRRAPAQAAAPVDADPAELREAADALASPRAGVDVQLAARVRSLQSRQSRCTRLRTGFGAGAAVVALGAVVAVMVGQVVATLAVAVAATLLALAAVLTGRFPQGEELADARAELAAQRRDAAKDADRRQRGEELAEQLGVAAKPEQLHELARDVEQAQHLESERDAWADERAGLDRDVQEADARLREALAARGANELTESGTESATESDGGSSGESGAPDLEALLAAYRRACRERAEQAQQAARRADLAARLVAQEAADRQAASVHRRHRAAEEAMVAAARRVVAESTESGEVPAAVEGLGDAGYEGRPAALAALDAALASWQRAHAARRRTRSTHERDRARLVNLLDGGTLAELRAAADDRHATARDHAAALTTADADLSDLADRDERDLHCERREVAEAADAARTRAAEAAGGLRRHEATMQPVAEAEESRARLADEVARLRSLGEVLDIARDHLQAASERVNRDIAPSLRGTVERWLPALTGGRYHRVAVDPATLEVSVDTPESGWQPAGRLSHGTSEQVYLLLRVALAEHLVTTDEPAPLLLDDVTAQSDDERTEAILDLLMELAATHQVVLFTQETMVRDWARTHLNGHDHRLVVLDPQTRRAGESPGRTSTAA